MWCNLAATSSFCSSVASDSSRASAILKKRLIKFSSTSIKIMCFFIKSALRIYWNYYKKTNLASRAAPNSSTISSMGTGIVSLKFWKQALNLFMCHIFSDSNKLRDEFDHPLNVENWNIQPVGKARLPQKKQMWKTTWNLFITFVTIVKSKMPWNIVRGHLTKLTTFIPISFSLFCDISTTLLEKSPAPAAVFTDNC